ncbi:C45 family autoproteolytic acyltransferase/hydolase [Vibrio sp. HN007]|uniref:C45 family autoproteolytic acyltransferase/hydolase n=1 Tax=Vibrio iocasae TaxID=3098914 RepID=UPI0035D49248
MKKTILASLVALSASGALVSNAASANTSSIEQQISISNDTSEFFTVEVSGTSYERGYQHGRELRKVIRHAVNRFKYDMVSNLLSKLGTELTYADFHKHIFNNTGLLKTAEREVPDLVEEMKGIADGSGLSFEDIFAWNATSYDAMFWVIEDMTGVDPMLAMEKELHSRAIPGHCSHASVWGDNKASVGYTLDWIRAMEGSQSLIKHVNEDGSVILMTAFAGMVGGHGIYATKGAAHTFSPHSKFQLEHSMDGLSQIFVYRKLLESGSVDNGIKFLNSIKPAEGLTYTLTDYTGTRAFEVSANKVVEFKMDGNQMVSANVARVNNDLSSSYKADLGLTGKKVDMTDLPAAYWEYNKDSVNRFKVLSSSIKGKTPADMNPEKWTEIFSQKPVNKPVDEKMETSNFWHVVEIDQEYINYHVAPSNPGNIKLESYRIKYN